MPRRLLPRFSPSRRFFTSAFPLRSSFNFSHRFRSFSSSAPSSASASSTSLPPTDTILAELDSNILALQCLRHSILVYFHVESKLSRESAGESSKSSIYHRILQNCQFSLVEFSSQSGEVIAERSRSEFSINFPGGRILFNSSWLLEQTKIRQMGIFSFQAELKAKIEEENAKENNRENSEEIIFSMNDTDYSGLSSEFLSSIQRQLGAENLSTREFCWLLSVLSTHPSDLAFDVFSAGLEGQRVN